MHDARFFSLSLFLLILALVYTAGCSFVEERPATAQLTVKVATIKIISQSDEIGPQDVIRHAEAARALLDGEVTLSRLASEVRERVGWDQLDAADRVLLDAVLTEAERRLRERIGEGVIGADARVTIETLLGWVIAAAQMAEVSGPASWPVATWADEDTETA